MNKEITLEKLFYMIQLAVQSHGDNQEFSLETEKQLDVIYQKLKDILKLK